MNVALFDYGAGNLHSLGKALEAGGAVVQLHGDPTRVLDADALVLPGVGAFGAAAERLAPGAHAIRVALQSGFPCLGICLGLQLLLDESEEGSGHGLGVIPGRVRKLQARRVPHIGWNTVDPMDRDPLFAGIGAFDAYFANSFVAEPADPGDPIAWTEHEAERFASAIRRHRVWGVQFHPEKSGAMGLRLLRNFLDAAARPGLVSA